MYNFLWNNKPDKIKRKQLIQNYQNGGLRMLDIDLFINSLKCSWIKRLFENKNKGQWKLFYFNKINNFGGKLLFESSLNKDVVLTMFPKRNFLQDILLSWVNVINNDVCNIKYIGKEIIWNNKNIKVNNKTFFYKNWFEKGIKNIEHIYDYRKKEFYHFEQLIELYQIPPTDYLKYNQLVSSIPREWKTRIKTESIIYIEEHTILDKIVKSDHVNKLIYTYQLKKEKEIDIKQHQKWKSDLNNNEIDWINVYSNTFISTIDSKLRNFQYKYLMRIIATNDVLLKYNLKTSNICDFCNMQIETAKHLFWECRHTQHFWNELSNFLKIKHMELNLGYELISCGITIINKNPNIKIKNYILLCAKYSIFLNKCHTTIPSFNCFKNYLYKQIDIEKIIAQQRDKLESHNFKWRAFF